MAQGERFYYGDEAARKNPEETLAYQNGEPGELVGHPSEIAMGAILRADTAQAAANTAQASADAAAALASNGVKPLKMYDFGQGSNVGWTPANCVAADQDFATARRLTANAGFPALTISGLSLAVADVNVVAVRLRVVSGTQGGGRLYYANAAHGNVDPHWSGMPTLSPGVWSVVVFDFRSVADFMSNGPTSGFVLRFGDAANLVVDVDWIAVGKYGAVSQESVDAAAQAAADAMTEAQLRALANLSNVVAGSVTATLIATGAVEAAKIADGAVLAAKLADGSVGSNKLVDGSVGTGKIADGSVLTAKLADNAVALAKIAANAVDATKLADGAVTAPKISAVMGGDNLVSNSSFELDTNADGLSDYWNAYNNSSGLQPHTLSRVPGLFGGNAQRISWSVDNTSTKGITTTNPSFIDGGGPSGDTFGIRGGWRFNTTYMVSFYARASGTVIGKTMGLYWNMVWTTQTAAQNPPLTADFQRYVFRLRMDPTAWTPSTAVSVGAYRTNGGNVYRCTTAGTTAASSGPTGTGTGIADGTAVWNYATGPRNEIFISIQSGVACNGSLDFDGMQIEEGEVASGYAPAAAEILDGVVTSAKIVAGAVTTAKLAAGAVTANEIAAGAVTTAKLAAGAVTANELAANSVVAGKIAALAVEAGDIAVGAVTATEIAAGAVTTAKLAVVSTAKSINADPGLEDPSAWQFLNTPGSFVEVADAPVGRTVIRGPTNNPSDFQDAPFYVLDTSKKYRVRVWVRRSADANGRFYCALRQYIDKLTPCATNSGLNPYKPGNYVPSTTWEEISFEWSSADWQVGVKLVKLYFILNYTGTLGYHEICNPRFEEMVSSELVVDGSITTGKLAANSVTADKILANSVLASKIAVVAPGAALNADPGMMDSSAWMAMFGRAFATFTTITDGKVGNNVARSAGAGVETWVNGSKPIPFDPAKTYRVRAWVQNRSGGGNVFYMGVALFDSAGANIAGNGSQWYYAASGVTAPGSWGEFVGTFGAGTANPFPAEARTMTPLFVLSYGGAGTNVHEIQDLRIEEMLPTTLIKDDSITTAKLVAGSVIAGKIGANAVGANEIAANAVTANKIAAGAVIADKIEANALGTADFAEDVDKNPTRGAKMLAATGATVYNSGTTYAQHDLVISAGIIYRSLQNTNLNHTPASSPTWWSVFEPLRVGPGGMRIGEFTLDEPIVAALRAIARDTVTAGLIWLRGNNDPNKNGGTPFVTDDVWLRSTAYKVGDRVAGDPTGGVAYPCHLGTDSSGTPGIYDSGKAQRVYTCTVAGTSASSGIGPTGVSSSIVDGTVTWSYTGTLVSQERISVTRFRGVPHALNSNNGDVVHLRIEITPRSDKDNLDALTKSTVAMFNNGVSGTPAYTWIQPLFGRGYGNRLTISNPVNAIGFVVYCNTESPGVLVDQSFGLYDSALRIQLFNTYGASAVRDFRWNSGAGIFEAGQWTSMGGGYPAPSYPPPSGGDCVSPETPIFIAPGKTIPISEIRAGDYVWTVPEFGGDLGYHRVTEARLSSNLRQRITFRDGRSFICSINHRLNVRGVWRRACNLEVGEEIQGAPSGYVAKIEYLGEGPVVALSIPTARTYLAGDGAWHHNNLKN